MFKVGVWFAAAAFCGAPLCAQETSKRPAEVKLIVSIQGKDLFKSYCASCHGLDAKGNGPMAASLKIPPSDLRRISIRNHDTFPMMRVEKIIAGEELTSRARLERNAGVGADLLARHHRCGPGPRAHRQPGALLARYSGYEVRRR